ncbi:unnamed protein product [Umbelopsis sp. WA50703]|jgi:hypothetical protein
MKTDIIKKRQRYESGPAAPKGKSNRKGKQEDGAESSRMSPPVNSEDNDPSGDNLEEDEMDYKFQQYPQNNNNNQNSGSDNMMMTGY